MTPSQWIIQHIGGPSTARVLDPLHFRQFLSKKMGRERGAVDRKNLKHLDSYFEIENDLLGKGTHGCVMRAKEKTSGTTFALKRINAPLEDEWVAAREIKLLQKLRGHPNVIRLVETFIDRSNKLVMQLEYAQHDFGALLESRDNNRPSLFSSMGAGQVKGYIQQILRGLEYCHSCNIIHRDLKPENILLTHENVVKLGDFGLAREQVPTYTKYTGGMQTQWVRAPEMCLGFKDYTVAVDMWSAGCIIGHFIYGSVMFPGSINGTLKQRDASQLEKIYELCGTPNPQNWLPDQRYAVKRSFKVPIARNVTERLLRQRDRHHRQSFNTKMVVDLLDKLLVLCPKHRMTAGAALKHPYLTEEFPRPYAPHEMLRYPTSNHIGDNSAARKKQKLN